VKRARIAPAAVVELEDAAASIAHARRPGEARASAKSRERCGDHRTLAGACLGSEP
jgi:hypothetical protein